MRRSTFGHFPAMQSLKCHHQILSWDNGWLQIFAKRLLVILLGTTLYSNLSVNFSLFIWLPDIFSFCRYTQSLHTDLCVYKYITSKRSSKVGGMSKSKSFDHVLWSRIPCLFLVESSFNLNLCMKVLVHTHGTQQTLWTIHIKEMRGVIFENDHIRFPHRSTLKFNKPFPE